jgi:hypothetical protein
MLYPYMIKALLLNWLSHRRGVSRTTGRVAAKRMLNCRHTNISGSGFFMPPNEIEFSGEHRESAATRGEVEPSRQRR